MTKSTPKTIAAKTLTSKKTVKPKSAQPKTKKVAVSAAKKKAPAVTAKKTIKKPVQRKVAKSPRKTAAPKPAAKKPAAVSKKRIAPKAATKPKAVTKPKISTKVVASAPKKPAVKKITAKKPLLKKATVKKSVLKKTVAKKAVVKKVQTSQATKDDLRKTIANLETRMKRADTLTRKSVKALESAVMTLDARTRKDSSTGKAALTRKVNQLSQKLTAMVEKTQADVNSELKTALTNPSVEGVQGALSRANERLTSAEQEQAAAISKVNRHLASIATAVDARIEQEAIARKAAITALKADTENSQKALTARIDTIEADTARALAGTGDKIAELSEELARRGEASELSIREKVSEVALKTQTEFETYRAGLDRRIDDISQAEPETNTQRLEQSIASLTARLEGLEYAVANTPHPSAALPETVQPAPPQLSLVPSQTLPQTITAEPQLNDAFSPLPQSATAPTAAMPNPYLTEPVEPASEVEAPAEQTGPVEFDPRSYMASRQKAMPAPPPPVAELTPAPLPPLEQDVLRDFTQPELMPNAQLSAELLPEPTMDQALPYADPAYADPAYVETDPTMNHLRIGGENTPKFNLPKLSGRNLRVAALATGVAVVGLVAAKGVFGDGGTSPAPQQTAQNAQPKIDTVNNVAPISAPTPDTSAAPIGKYADNKAVNVAPSSDAAKTLNSAASEGDPVAQFQLGLSYLEQGRTNEGVSLIRKSANQNQPAAQYRLAKLYEIGEGVSQDPEMARQLTERAAANGNRIAMHDLALYYAEGRGGVTADLPTAAKWFEKAAERGVVDSQFNLGVLFESGQGLPKNMTDAYVWYSIAAGQGDQFAKTRIEVLKEALEPADLVTAASRAEKFKPVKIDEAANGIFRNVAWAKSKTPNSGQISQVRQAQTMLSELGYEIGGADGSIGPKTRAAIMSFERTNSLPETGRVNASLIDRLELATGA